MKSSTITPSSLAIAFALLQGCVAPSSSIPPPVTVVAQSAAQPPSQQKTCDAAGAQFAVGQPWNSPLAENARQRAGADSVRALRPNQMVTMEFDNSRLNLELDAAGRVTRVRCG